MQLPLFGKIKIAVAACAVSLAFASPASAAAFKFAGPLDAYTLDPHAVSNTLVFAVLSNVYEPLVRRSVDLKPEAALATSWKQTDPLTWRFELRKDVKFHDGSPFAADDVIFSFNRAKAGGVKTNLSTLDSIAKIDEHTVDIKTKDVDPIVPLEIANWFMMSRRWAEKNGAVQPGAADNKTETFANRNANGTGPYKIVARDPGVKTEFELNPNAWEKPAGNIDKATFFVIPNASTRVSALVSGEVDMIDGLPPQDTQRIENTKGLSVKAGPDLRTIYLQPDVARDELMFSDVKGKNPFKDKRVRQAMQLAIDLDAIKTKVMRGYSIPTGLPIGKEVNGYVESLGRPVAPDVAKAKSLVAEAGYPDGFTVTLDCTNDRFMNDEATCIAIASSLGRIGIKVTPRAQPTAKWAQQINPPGYATSLALLGYSPATYDAHIFLSSITGTRDATTGRGTFNIGGFSDPRVDELITKIQSNANQDERRAQIAEALAIIKESAAYIPIHQLNILWGIKDNVTVVQPADLSFPLRLFSVK
jgi:peptide/nickel transport system substrate-binding protein